MSARPVRFLNVAFGLALRVTPFMFEADGLSARSGSVRSPHGRMIEAIV